MIHQCQISEASTGKFKALLEEFYSDSPERLKAAIFGLTFTVKNLQVIQSRMDCGPTQIWQSTTLLSTRT